MLSYALVTPAHNEEQFLERTIDAVRRQSYMPVRWIIVDDGSQDATRAIAQNAALRLSIIRVISVAARSTRSFGYKADAFNLGVQALADVDYDLIGNLDADISLGPNHFCNLVKAFEDDDRLGITGGTVFTRLGRRYVTSDTTADSVAGATQLFRRQCFEDIGGYMPLRFGGIDAAAEIIAKSKGWKVQKSFRDRVDEHRQTGTASSSPLAASVQLGRRFYSLGYDYLFFAARCLFRVADPPFLVGSCGQLCGYLAAAIKRDPIVLDRAVVEHLRASQRQRLRPSLILKRP